MAGFQSSSSLAVSSLLLKRQQSVTAYKSELSDEHYVRLTSQTCEISIQLFVSQ